MLQVNDQIKIVRVNLSGEDYFVLSQMYLPLIGMDSFSLFIALNNIHIKDSTTTILVSKLLDLLNITNIGILENSFYKLEAIGLVKRYLSDRSGNYLFEMQIPLDAKSFLNNSLLSNYLFTKIGEVEIESLKKTIIKSKVSGYKEISKRFDEVFKTGNKKTTAFVENIKRDLKDNIRVKNDKFDYTIFKLYFNSDFIDLAILDDESFEQEILRISYQYQLDEKEMYEAVFKAVTIGNNLSYNEISKNAGYIYQNKVVDKPLVFEAKEAVEFTEDISEDVKKVVRLCESISPARCLEYFSNGKASLADLKKIEKLSLDTGLPDSVINVLISYILVDKDGIPSYNYIEKIARTWIRVKITTALEAIKYINRQDEKKQTPTKTYKKSEKVNPEWVNAYMDNIKEKWHEEDLTNEEIDAGLDAGKKLFKK